MLSGYDLNIRGLVVGEDESEDLCRPCAVKRFGEASVARIYQGLGAGLPHVRVLTRYEADEAAAEKGYEMPHGCGPDSTPPCEAKEIDGDLFCMACSVWSCSDCDARLDTSPEEEAAHAA